MFCKNMKMSILNMNIRKGNDSEVLALGSIVKNKSCLT